MLFTTLCAMLICHSAGRQSHAVDPAAPHQPLPQQSYYGPVPSGNGPDLVPPAGDVVDEGYWVISSRRSTQHERENGRWGVDVFRRSGPRQVRGSNIQEFASSLTPGVPVCIFTHGSFVSWPSHLQQAEATNRWLRRAGAGAPLHVVFFTWPSDSGAIVTPLDVSVRGRRAEFNGLHLAWVLSQIPEACPVCLIGHSHGARVTLSTMHLIGGGQVQGLVYNGPKPQSKRYRVVLAAAAVDHDWINPSNRYGQAVCQLEGLMNLQNRTDLALGLYPLRQPFSNRALGEAGFSATDRYMQGPHRCKMIDVDVTPLLGAGHNWPLYLATPQIASTIAPFVYHQDVSQPALTQTPSAGNGSDALPKRATPEHAPSPLAGRSGWQPQPPVQPRPMPARTRGIMKPSGF
ncbi:alpha/beta hydrolase family protein [Maioricimonas rarisocia]|uniref:alpha/beta hydrolase n=1 Tax=Maioricimonas rarisocia TaxID=2528026 RepID=UPI0018D259D2|nr:alpha/beta hydrolase [Maioricimonas rarisocia]